MAIFKCKSFNLFCKKSLCILASFIIGQTAFAQYSSDNVFDYKKLPLEEVLNEWSNTFDITFSYDFDLIKGKWVEQSFSHLSLEDKLLKLLRETDLEFKIIDKKSIVLKKRRSTSQEEYQTEICGQVLDTDSNISLPFVNIIIENTGIGVTTDEHGNFSLKALFVKDDVLVFSFLGYEHTKKSPDFFRKKPCAFLRLKMKVNEMEEVIVKDSHYTTGDNTLFSLAENSNATTFQFQHSEDIGGLAEKDVMQTLQLLPGISGSDESASRLHIRGGSAGQNLVLFDNIPMYHFGHFFGKIASINPNMVEEVSVSKEGYSAQYGGRVAGVIDIRGKSIIPDSFQLNLEGSFLSGNVNLTLPLRNKKAAIFMAYRRSFTDFYNSTPFQKFFNQIFQNSRITDDESDIQLGNLDSMTTLSPNTSYSDVSAKILWKPNIKNLLSLSYLHTGDKMTYQLKEVNFYNEVDKLNVGNSGINMKWEHNWKENISTTGSMSWSKYNNRFIFSDNLVRDSAATVRDNDNQIIDYSFQLINRIKKARSELAFGYHFNKINEEAHTFKRDSGAEDEYFDDDVSGILHALFIDYNFAVYKNLNINLGSRMTHYDLTDKFYFEPRFVIKTQPLKSLRFRVAGGLYYQAINQIIETNKLNVEDHLWLLSRESQEEGSPFSVVKNKQLSLGVSYQKNGWIVDFGTYKKHFDGVISHILRFDATGFPFITGQMSASGFEASLQKKQKWYYTFLSYTLSKVNYTFEYPEYPVPASYNRQHSFTWLQGFNYRNFTIASTLKIASGRPFTPLDFRDEDLTDPTNPNYWLVYEKFNQKLLPTYQRLDFTLSWKFITKSISGKISIAAMNLLNRTNYLQRLYLLRFSPGVSVPPKVEQLDRTGLPFTPNISMAITFGK